MSLDQIGIVVVGGLMMLYFGYLLVQGVLIRKRYGQIVKRMDDWLEDRDP